MNDDDSGYEAGSEASSVKKVDESGYEAGSEEASNKMDDDQSVYEAGSEGASPMDHQSGRCQAAGSSEAATPMDEESGCEAKSRSKDQPTLFLRLKPINNKGEPCQVCGSNANELQMMTCLICRETQEHIYCGRTKLQRVPYMWLCETCRKPPPVADKSAPAPSFHVVEVPIHQDTTEEESTHESSHPISPCPPPGDGTNLEETDLGFSGSSTCPAMKQPQDIDPKSED